MRIFQARRTARGPNSRRGMPARSTGRPPSRLRTCTRPAACIGRGHRSRRSERRRNRVSYTCRLTSQRRIRTRLERHTCRGRRRIPRCSSLANSRRPRSRFRTSMCSAPRTRRGQSSRAGKQTTRSRRPRSRCCIGTSPARRRCLGAPFRGSHAARDTRASSSRGRASRHGSGSVLMRHRTSREQRRSSCECTG